MKDFIQGRKIVLGELRKEMVGPSPSGSELDCSPESEVIFASPEDFYKAWRQKGTGQEIIRRNNPCKRYGVGVLYPLGSGIEIEEIAGDDVPEATEEGVSDSSDIVNASAEKDIQDIAQRTDGKSAEVETDDFGITTANAYLPSSIAVSFLAEFSEGARLVVEVPRQVIADNVNAEGSGDGIKDCVEVNGRYVCLRVRSADLKRKWWLRTSVEMKAEFELSDLLTKADGKVTGGRLSAENLGPLDLDIEVYSRRVEGNSQRRLLTVCLINRTMKDSPGMPADKSLFQAYFKAKVISPGKVAQILPYPGPPIEKMDEEEKSLRLLYRNAETFAVGHGCAADWEQQEGLRTVSWVSAECLPIHETPLEVSMAELAGLVDGNDGMSSLEDVVSTYKRWIDQQRESIKSLPIDYRSIAEEHMKKCIICWERMKDGMECLKTPSVSGNQEIIDAFKMANHAMFLQQRRASREPRMIKFNVEINKIEFSRPFTQSGKGMWRAFQIAFFLMTLKSTADSQDPFRENVELIWFPTGGGKTEAYLGLSAFATFIRRIRNPQDSGVNVLMRYTLRLLTSQQFQRGCGLICAMESIRQKNIQRLGEREFSIGLWLGKSFTPNKRSDAKTALSRLKRDSKADNPFVIRKCPWCGAQMGPIEVKQGATRRGLPRAQMPTVFGYQEGGGTVGFHCSDSLCDFHKKLPIYIIDEDIYEKRPDILIGTVDKFAMLAWNSKTRSIFGLDEEGKREFSPPGLVIQDELHLISGPLGSIVGLNEVLIEELCTDRRDGEPRTPKRVCSTATIRRYAEQVEALYGRNKVTLFPSPGLDTADSFFAKYARVNNSQGKLKPGKIYVGICAPGLGSTQTAQVRVNSALLQAPMHITEADRDPWWTLLNFYNSLRELGGSISLLQADIPDYFKVLWQRYGTLPEQKRYLHSVKELTSRLREDEIPKAIEELEVEYVNKQSYAVDCCLASNIIEVGVDIDRLSLMVVVGQPKSTSQYIQVTGRVGRKWWERPGLVVTIYAAGKPRDKSHYEKFRSYHQQLYAQVEPTSVTPCSLPVLERVMHAAMVAYVRQTGNSDLQKSPYPYPDKILKDFRLILEKRIIRMNKREQADVLRIFDQRSEEWKGWERTMWDSFANMAADVPLIHLAGSYVNEEWRRYSWPTMMSMRNVDADCQAEVTKCYLQRGES